MISESDSRGSHIIRVITLCVITLLTDSGERKGKRPRCNFNSFASSLDGPNISKSITLTLYSKNRNTKTFTVIKQIPCQIPCCQINFLSDKIRLLWYFLPKRFQCLLLFTKEMLCF